MPDYSPSVRRAVVLAQQLYAVANDADREALLVALMETGDSTQGEKANDVLFHLRVAREKQMELATLLKEIKR